MVLGIDTAVSPGNCLTNKSPPGLAILNDTIFSVALENQNARHLKLKSDSKCDSVGRMDSCRQDFSTKPVTRKGHA